MPARKPKKIKPIVRVKRRGRLYGGIYELSNGEEIYVAYREEKHFFRGGEKSKSDAASLNKLSWALDDDTLRMIRARGIETVAIRIKETLDYYVTSVENYFNPLLVQFHDYSARGGELQRYLNVRHFLVRYATAKFR